MLSLVVDEVLVVIYFITLGDCESWVVTWSCRWTVLKRVKVKTEERLHHLGVECCWLKLSVRSAEIWTFHNFYLENFFHRGTLALCSLDSSHFVYFFIICSLLIFNILFYIKPFHSFLNRFSHSCSIEQLSKIFSSSVGQSVENLSSLITSILFQ